MPGDSARVGARALVDSGIGGIETMRGGAILLNSMTALSMALAFTLRPSPFTCGMMSRSSSMQAPKLLPVATMLPVSALPCRFSA